MSEYIYNVSFFHWNTGGSKKGELGLKAKRIFCLEPEFAFIASYSPFAPRADILKIGFTP
jgi:hypothetical protein